MADGLCFLRVASILMVAGGLMLGKSPGASQEESRLYSYLYPRDDLGAVYRPQATTIKLWAPTAMAVGIELFDDATNQSFSSRSMVCDSNGIWSAAINGDLDGKYYLFEIALPGRRAGQPVTYRVNDPYARGCSANTGRTLIYDPAKTNPEGWVRDQFVKLKSNTDA
ncbi:MAG: hypothetical protein WBW41_20455, partial [Verrucomicrobiia bacterium]